MPRLTAVEVTKTNGSSLPPIAPNMSSARPCVAAVAGDRMAAFPGAPPRPDACDSSELTQPPASKAIKAASGDADSKRISPGHGGKKPRHDAASATATQVDFQDIRATRFTHCPWPHAGYSRRRPVERGGPIRRHT